MSDRELMELAAKACGKDVDLNRYDEDDGFAIRHMAIWWNPLVDDGDALRLAVRLNMLVDVMTAPAQSHAIGGGLGASGERIEPHSGNDKYAATRRAIVKVAAEIGRKMP